MRASRLALDLAWVFLAIIYALALGLPAYVAMYGHSDLIAVMRYTELVSAGKAGFIIGSAVAGMANLWMDYTDTNK